MLAKTRFSAVLHTCLLRFSAAAALQAAAFSNTNLLENVIRKKTGRGKKILSDHKIFQI